MFLWCFRTRETVSRSFEWNLVELIFPETSNVSLTAGQPQTGCIYHSDGHSDKWYFNQIRCPLAFKHAIWSCVWPSLLRLLSSVEDTGEVFFWRLFPWVHIGAGVTEQLSLPNLPGGLLLSNRGPTCFWAGPPDIILGLQILALFLLTLLHSKLRKYEAEDMLL